MNFNASDRVWSLGRGLQVQAPAMGSAWWLSGGIAAANCVAAYQAKGAASLAASYINLTGNATYNAAPGNDPTWNATDGWIFNGTDDYLKTGITPNAANYSMIIRFSSLTASGDRIIAGVYASAFFMLDIDFGSNFIYFGNGDYKGKAGTLTSGVLCVSGTEGYINGIGQGLSMSNAGANGEIYIGALNYSGASYFVAGKIQAMAIYNNLPLSTAQVLSLTNAMNAL